MASFGWTYLSQEALRRAEAHLSGASEDVRDEVGFLLVHQRYADLFFPGTSVLHTRLRYVLFVPWVYRSLWRSPPKGDFAKALAEAETRLVGRLKAARQEGIIGGRLHPKASGQPPSAVYWTALGAWGIVASAHARSAPPTRAQVHEVIRRGPRAARDDDGRPLQNVEFPFDGVPDEPPEWNEPGPLDFRLLDEERDYLRARLMDVRSRAQPHRPSLLSRLARRKVTLPEHAWGEAVLDLAGEDRDALARAGQAAALAAVGRGVYAALLERSANKGDAEVSHADRLARAVRSCGRRARLLDLGAMRADIGTLPEVVQRVLEKTQEWLEDGAGDPEPLREWYAAAELARKKRLARLPDTLDGARRRADWDADGHPAPAELHYRWWRVSGLLRDLHG